MRSVVRDVQGGSVVHFPAFHLGRRLPGDQPAHAEPADGQRRVALPLARAVWMASVATAALSVIDFVRSW